MRLAEIRTPSGTALLPVAAWESPGSSCSRVHGSVRAFFLPAVIQHQYTDTKAEDNRISDRADFNQSAGSFSTATACARRNYSAYTWSFTISKSRTSRARSDELATIVDIPGQDRRRFQR